MSHSKRNTSRAVFTSYERSLAKAAWTQSSARLTRDSFLPFASCSLCLEPAVDPVACPAGDIFCRECALNNILAQKKDARRQEKLQARDERERLERRAREDAEAQAHAIRDFELVQAGLDSKTGRTGPGPANGRNGRESSTSHANGTTVSPLPLLPSPAGTAPSAPTIKLLEGGDGGTASEASHGETSRKRKFTLDEDELRRVAEADRSWARRAIEAERAAAHDAKALPSFWTPSETPSADRKNEAPIKGGPTPKDENNGNNHGNQTSRAGAGAWVGQPLCPASRDAHTYSLHTLVPVHFAVDNKDQRVCPACNKTLSNTSKAVLAKPCGHVLCRSCVHQFVKPPGANGTAVLFDPHAPPGTTGTVRCYVCDADLEEDGTVAEKKRDKKAKKDKKDKERVKPGLVDLRSEGTGFSASGAREVKRNDVAFQC
ncbi:Zinc finger, RING/FYVE/PHD-type [Niveomyces insectorum RCEF 264]|uniref:Zinc finger, RING/FYVE/PHD-type n=1 Tax=Niveomyces insectorum RCEF 264 TaxID=1081102 RepID=A0A167M9D0_9HYPO|nr:Zinc finger, RING/FYVE/PHD-type [Niveomyces insectorum RCEF 264]